MFFKKDFFSWLEEDGFYIRDVWDEQKGRFGGPGFLKLFPFQEKILRAALEMNEDGTFKYETIVYSTPKKAGKALSVDTPIPVPSGWKSMGELNVGDDVFDDKGNVCSVTYVTDVMHGHDCYRITFSDHSTIVADAEHQWCVGARRKVNPSMSASDGGMYWGVLTTQQMSDGPWITGKDNLSMYQIPITLPLELPEADLPIPPYLLGAWLGDGHSVASIITVADGDKEILAHLGVEYKLLPATYNKKLEAWRTPMYRINMGKFRSHKTSFSSLIRALGIYGNKGIPDIYLRSSVSQRKELLRGLMDTDGFVSANRGRCEYASISERLISDIAELLRSLGIKCHITHKKTSISGREVGVAHRIHFQLYDDERWFYLDRKQDRLRSKPKWKLRSQFMHITNIDKVDSVPVKCIQVDSPSHLYLAGTSMIPTHNTILNAAISSWFLECCPEGTETYTIANSAGQSEERVLKDIRYHFKKRNEQLEFNVWKLSQDRIENRDTGTFMMALAQSNESSAGSRHALTAWDEGWGIKSEADLRMWEEMTPIPTIPYSLRLMSTYAGYYGESLVLWDLYISGVGTEEHQDGRGTPVPGLEGLPCWSNGKLFMYWDHEARLPWQTEEYYDQQMKTLRAAQYLRLHENRWVTTQETFIPIAWWDSASTLLAPVDIWEEHPYRMLPVYIGVDASSKRDCTAIVGVSLDNKKGRIGLMFHRIWTPIDGVDFDLDKTVEAFLLECRKKYNVAKIAYDPTFIHQTMVRLRSIGMRTEEIPQTVDRMTKVSQSLFDLLQNQRIDVYKDAEARQHVLNAVAKQEVRGFRIVKDKQERTVRKPVDFTVALAMACYAAIESGTVNTGASVVLSSPFSDHKGWKNPDASQAVLPWELRD